MLAAAKSVKEKAAAYGKHVSVVVWFDSFRIYANKTLNPYTKGSAGINCMNSRAAHYLESSTDHMLKNASGVHVKFSKYNTTSCHDRDLGRFRYNSYLDGLINESVGERGICFE